MKDSLFSISGIKHILLGIGLILTIGLIPIKWHNQGDYLRLIVVHSVIIAVLVIDFFRGRKYVFDFYDLLFYLYVFWHFLSYTWTDYPGLIWYESFHMLSLLGVFTVLRNTDFANYKKYWINLFFFLLLFNAATLFYFILDAGLIYSQKIVPGNVTVDMSWTFGHNCNYVTSSLAVSIPLLFYASKGSKLRSLLALPILTVFSLVIIICASRASFLALILVGFGLIAINAKTLLKHKKVLIGLVVSSVIAIVMTANFSMQTLERLNPLTSLKKGAGDDRLLLWKLSGDLIKESPFRGHGANTWKIRHLYNGISENLSNDDIGFQYTHSHNQFLETGAELGLVGMLLLVVICLLACYSVFSIYNKREHFYKYLLMSLLAVLVVANFYGLIYTNHRNFGFMDILLFGILAVSVPRDIFNDRLEFTSLTLVLPICITFGYDIYVWLSLIHI